MEILIIGTQAQQEEAKKKFGDSHRYVQVIDQREAVKLSGTCDAVFDFTAVETPSQPPLYQRPFSFAVFLDTSLVSLLQLGAMDYPGTVFGFCGMPSFLNRALLEVSTIRSESQESLKQVCSELKTEYKVVADRVGLVTPRVICMIINEAYFTVYEGTATREDIDLAMKLGTHYPYGPFEWCRRIGAANVCRVLKSVYKDTRDERYKICPLLEEEAGL